MPRAAAIILQNAQVALIERHRAGRHYFLFPGGGVDPGETLKEAAIREVREELGLEVEIGRLVAEITYDLADANRRQQFYFLATVTGGVFGTGHGAEMTSPPLPEDGTYAPLWMPVAALLTQPVYPRAIAEIIARAAQHGWPQTPPTLVDTGL